MKELIDKWVERHTTQGAFCPMISVPVRDFRAIFEGMVLVPVDAASEAQTALQYVMDTVMTEDHHEAADIEKAIAAFIGALTASEDKGHE